MNFKVSLILLLLVTMSGIISACNGRKIPLRLIYSSNNCPIGEQALNRTDSHPELSRLFDSQLGNFAHEPAINIEVDYDKQTLIVLALGQKPTTGYRIDIFKKEATIRGQKLFLPVRILPPDKNKLQAQVITSPCWIFSLPHADYTEIILEDYSSD